MNNLTKKIIETTLMGVIVFSLTGCGNTSEIIENNVIEDEVIIENNDNEINNMEEVSTTKNYILDDDSKNYKEVQTISLKSNPTTGYDWTYEIEDDSVAIVKNEKYVMVDAEEGMVGVGGARYYDIAGLKEGKTNIIFKYMRGFEGPESTIETVVIEIDVNNENKISIITDQNL